jgi:HEAT repeat protein
MWEWFFFWKRAGKPSASQSASVPKASAEPLESAPHPPREQGATKPEAEPVLVRGGGWKNTATDPEGSPPQPEPQPALGIPDLIQLLRDKEPQVRMRTLELLARLGPKARAAIPALLVTACDVDATVRKAAAGLLNQVDPGWPTNPNVSGAVGDLIKEMGRRSSDIAQTASLLLSRIGPSAVGELAQALAEGANDIRQVFVAQTLARIGPPAAPAVPALALALTSEFAHVRQAAAEALTAIGQASEPAVPALILALADWNPGVRQAAARSLARVGRAAELAVAGLIQLLADRDEAVREAAIEAHAQVGPGSVPLLQELLQILDSRQLEEWLRQKVTAADLCTNVGEHLAEGGVVRIACRSDDPALVHIQREPLKALRNLSWCFQQAVEDHLRMETTREAAVKALGKIGPAACVAVPTLVEALADKKGRIRSAAARSLGQVGQSARAACVALVRALADSSEGVRKAAVEALAKIDPDWASNCEVQGVVEALAEQLKQSTDARQAAVEAFVVIGSPSVPVLVQALASEDRVLREAAATTLGRIGAAAQAATPALVRALQDGHGWVSEAAAQALQKIDPQGLRDRTE